MFLLCRPSFESSNVLNHCIASSPLPLPSLFYLPCLVPLRLPRSSRPSPRSLPVSVPPFLSREPWLGRPSTPTYGLIDSPCCINLSIHPLRLQLRPLTHVLRFSTRGTFLTLAGGPITNSAATPRTPACCPTLRLQSTLDPDSDQTKISKLRMTLLFARVC